MAKANTVQTDQPTPDVMGVLSQVSREAAEAHRSLARMPLSTPDDDSGLWNLIETGPRNPILEPDFALDD